MSVPSSIGLFTVNTNAIVCLGFSSYPLGRHLVGFDVLVSNPVLLPVFYNVHVGKPVVSLCLEVSVCED